MRNLKELTWEIVGAAIEVHRSLGPGLLEASYRKCLLHELETRGLAVKAEVPIEIHYKGLHLPAAYRADLVIEATALVELKAIEKTLPVHEAQVLTYLRHTGLQIGLLLNFNVPVLKDGIRRFIRADSSPTTEPTFPS
jgi:GxxExxY protein